MVTEYQRGANFERAIMEELTELGYFCIRSAGSHHLADVIAISDGGARPILIQAKCGKGTISTDDWNGLVDLAERYDCIPVLASLDKSERKHRTVYQYLLRKIKPRERREGCLRLFTP